MTANVRFVLALSVVWLTQAAVVPFLAVGMVQPDIVLILVCVFGIINGPAPGAVGGFVAGLMQDLLVPGSIGLGALVKTVMGYLSGEAEQTILGDNVLMPVAIIASVSLVSQIVYMALLILVGESVGFVSYLTSTVLPSSAYTAGVGLLLLAPLRAWLTVGPSEAAFE